MKIDNRVLIAGIAIYGFYEWDKFTQIIDNVKLELQVLKVSNDTASAIIKSDIVNQLPKFKAMDLILDKQTHLATSKEPNVNKALLPFIGSPLDFNLLQPTTKPDLEKAEIAITYSFFGFPVKRLYTPTILTETATKNELFETGKPSSKCGCKH